MEVLIGLHSFWRWILLAIAVATVVVGLLGWLRGQRWSTTAAMLSRLLPIAIDLQVVLGVALWLSERRWTGGNFFFSILHPLMGLAALAIAHVVGVMIKRRQDDAVRYRLMALGYLLVLVVAALAVPSDAW